jgi:hypothetical protein
MVPNNPIQFPSLWIERRESFFYMTLPAESGPALFPVTTDALVMKSLAQSWAGFQIVAFRTPDPGFSLFQITLVQHIFPLLVSVMAVGT